MQILRLAYTTLNIMIQNVFASIYLDKRRAKSNGKFPVKLRVFIKHPRKQKLYPTNYEFTEAEFNSIWNSKKARQVDKPIRLDLQNLENLAYEVAQKIIPFDFQKFENMLFGYSGQFDNLYAEYEKSIQNFKKHDRISSAETYDLSIKSIKKFISSRNGKTPSIISFKEITPDFLKQYERYMISNGRSLTSVGIYLRCLRAVFNNAIENKVIEKDYYPFGKRKYQIPAPKAVKKALTKEQLSLLFNAEPETPEQAKAKDFFFLSYACNGINFKDLAYLKYKNYNKETFTFYRAKTSSTQRDQAPVIIYVNDFIKQVIDKYGNENNSPDDYIFKMVDHSEDADIQRKHLKNFIRYVNQHFSKFAKNNGIKENISTYWARHSFATNAIRNGASMEFVSEALSHSNLRTTQGYFAGFEDKMKKDIANKIMDL
jgi:integrase/recombinase XerD